MGYIVRQPQRSHGAANYSSAAIMKHYLPSGRDNANDMPQACGRQDCECSCAGLSVDGRAGDSSERCDCQTHGGTSDACFACAGDNWLSPEPHGGPDHRLGDLFADVGEMLYGWVSLLDPDMVYEVSSNDAKASDAWAVMKAMGLPENVISIARRQVDQGGIFHKTAFELCYDIASRYLRKGYLYNPWLSDIRNALVVEGGRSDIRSMLNALMFDGKAETAWRPSATGSDAGAWMAAFGCDFGGVDELFWLDPKCKPQWLPIEPVFDRYACIRGAPANTGVGFGDDWGFGCVDLGCETSCMPKLMPQSQFHGEPLTGTCTCVSPELWKPRPKPVPVPDIPVVPLPISEPIRFQLPELSPQEKQAIANSSAAAATVLLVIVCVVLAPIGV